MNTEVVLAQVSGTVGNVHGGLCLALASRRGVTLRALAGWRVRLLDAVAELDKLTSGSAS